MQNPVIKILSAAFIVVTLFCAYLAEQLQKKRRTIEQYQSAITEKDAIIKYKTVDNGRIVAEKASADITIGNAIKLYNNEISALKTQIGLTAKDIKGLKSYIQAGFSAKDSGITITHHHFYYDSTKRDSVESRDIDVSDGYMHFQANVLPNKSFWKYDYNDTITAVGRTTKKWLFGNETFLIDAGFRNRHAKVTGIKSFRIDEFKDKRFGIGPAIIWSPQLPKSVIVGIGIHYDLFKF